MALEAHATAAGAGHPPAGGDPPPGALVNLAETVVIKEENVFAVMRRDGSAPVAGSHPFGVYVDDCRFVSGHELRVNGVRPRLLVTSAAPGSESIHELTNPALPLRDDRVLPLQSLQIRLERCLRRERGVEETLVVRSYDRGPLELDVELALAADFEPMLAIRGIVPVGAGEPVRTEPLDRGVRFAIRGRDGLYRTTTVTTDRPVARGDAAGTLRFPLSLPPGGAETIRLRYALEESTEPAGATAPAAPERPPAGRAAAHGSRSGRWSRPTTCSSTGSSGARCSTSACCIRATAPTATTPPECPGTRRCSGATR